MKEKCFFQCCLKVGHGIHIAESNGNEDHSVSPVAAKTVFKIILFDLKGCGVAFLCRDNVDLFQIQKLIVLWVSKMNRN